MRKKIALLLAGFFAILCLLPVSAQAAKPQTKGKILFVPHDNRPISDAQTADTVRCMGYEVIVPPSEMLGGRDDLGHPDQLWQWVDENAKKADAVVLSSDAMLYGSLVGSRKHEYTQSQLGERAAHFVEFREKYPKLRIYAFGSIMRTPRSAAASGTMEPGYYQSYGSDIFRYTALNDKKEMEGLTRREAKELDFLTKLIPSRSLRDWMDRRAKNVNTSHYLIDLTRKGVLDYFVLGRDDNAPYSQTHMESRKLSSYGSGLPQSKFQTMAGIDEMGMLMLTRAVNDMTKSVPFVYVHYNWGAGSRTIPAYSDEPIANSIRAAIIAVGGMQVTSPQRADLVLFVNTNPNGKTFEAGTHANDGTPREGTKYFADIVTEEIDRGSPVGIADIAYANGADNALMELLKNRGLLFKLRAYSGWNTATNSTGFVIAQGVLSNRMSNEAREHLLLMRYLDDWAYQANVRLTLGNQLGWLRGSGVYSRLDDKREGVEYRGSKMMREFAADNLASVAGLQDLEISFPWNRLFETEIHLTSDKSLLKF